MAQNPTNQPHPNAIAARAYQIWEADGSPHGDDQKYWYTAEQQLSKGGPKPTTQPKPPEKPANPTA